VALVVDALSRLEIDSLKIQEEDKVLTLFSVSENISISNIILNIPMHTVLTFKEQAKFKGIRENGLAQPHYSIQETKRTVLVP
jgi:hypothetical protein